MKTVILKLVTGEDIIGRLEEYDTSSKHYVMHDVLAIRKKFSQFGIPAIYMTKYCMYNDSYDVDFRIKDVMNVFYDPKEGMVDYYEYNLKYIKDYVEKEIEREFKIATSDEFSEEAMTEELMILDSIVSSNNTMQ